MSTVQQSIVTVNFQLNGQNHGADTVALRRDELSVCSKIDTRYVLVAAAVIEQLTKFVIFSVLEKMAENIREEIKRLHRRKQLSFNHTQQAIEQMQDSESSGSEMGAESPRRPDTPPTAVRNPEMALFTFKQVCCCCFLACLCKISQ